MNSVSLSYGLNNCGICSFLVPLRLKLFSAHIWWSILQNAALFLNCCCIINFIIIIITEIRDKAFVKFLGYCAFAMSFTVKLFRA